jgi:prepilin-type N-terminal cleavage/methylation domain-containing protein
MKPRNPRGFSVIELMIVVSILGVLASVAVPAFLKYVLRAKTTEATMNIRKLFDGSVAYYLTDRYDPAGVLFAHQFPNSVGPTPSPSDLRSKRFVVPASAWEGEPSWQALNFSVGDPVYYAYQYVSSGRTNQAIFTGIAYGNLDGDSTYSTFYRSGKAVDEEIVGSPGMTIVFETD